MRGNEPFLTAFRNPPQTTRAILSPAEPAAAPPPLELPAVPEEPYLIESAGQLGLRLWLEPTGDVGAASEIASCWKNDRYLLFPDGEASSAVLWDIELESKDAADRFQAAALDRVSAMAGLEGSAALGKVVTTPATRHFNLGLRLAKTK